MGRITDEKGQIVQLRRPDRAGPALWAQIGRERDALPWEVVQQAAREHIARKMARQKLNGKPRMRIFPKLNGVGFWYVLYVGRYYIRAKDWDVVVRRAAYGPWSDMGSSHVPYATPGRIYRNGPQ